MRIVLAVFLTSHFCYQHLPQKSYTCRALIKLYINLSVAKRKKSNSQKVHFLIKLKCEAIHAQHV